MRSANFYIREFTRARMLESLVYQYGRARRHRQKYLAQQYLEKIRVVESASNESFSQREETRDDGFCDTCSYEYFVIVATCATPEMTVEVEERYLFKAELDDMLEFTKTYDEENPE